MQASALYGTNPENEQNPFWHAECHYAECHYAECHYAECNYAESHSAGIKSLSLMIWRVGTLSLE